MRDDDFELSRLQRGWLENLVHYGEYTTGSEPTVYVSGLNDTQRGHLIESVKGKFIKAVEMNLENQSMYFWFCYNVINGASRSDIPISSCLPDPRQHWTLLRQLCGSRGQLAANINCYVATGQFLADAVVRSDPQTVPQPTIAELSRITEGFATSLVIRTSHRPINLVEMDNDWLHTLRDRTTADSARIGVKVRYTIYGAVEALIQQRRLNPKQSTEDPIL